MRVRPWRMLVLALALGLAGCGGRSGNREEKLVIGMMPKVVGISYFNATAAGAKEAAEELQVELRYDGPTDPRVEDQATMVQKWIAEGCDVIAVAPNDPDVIAKSLRDAKRAGVSVLTWDTDAQAETSQRSVFVNQAPNEAIAEALVEVMVEGVKGRGQPLAGKYLMVSGTPTASNQNTWMRLMKARIAEKYPEIELLPHLTPGEDQRAAQDQTREQLSQHEDLKGIWGLTSVSLPGAAKATRDANKQAQVYVTGLSLPLQMRQFVKDGVVEKFLLWDARDLGYLTVHVAKRLHEGTLKPGLYDMGRLKGIRVTEDEVLLGPPLFFDANNIDDFDF